MLSFLTGKMKMTQYASQYFSIKWKKYKNSLHTIPNFKFFYLNEFLLEFSPRKKLSPYKVCDFLIS